MHPPGSHQSLPVRLEASSLDVRLKFQQVRSPEGIAHQPIAGKHTMQSRQMVLRVVPDSLVGRERLSSGQQGYRNSSCKLGMDLEGYRPLHAASAYVDAERFH